MSVPIRDTYLFFAFDWRTFKAVLKSFAFVALVARQVLPPFYQRKRFDWGVLIWNNNCMQYYYSRETIFPPLADIYCER